MEIPPFLPADHEQNASTSVRLPPVDTAAGGGGAASLSPGAGSPAAAVAAPASEAALAGAAAPLADQVRIHPLDVVGALQILIAEVRADLSLPGDVPHIEFAAPPLLPASVQANAPVVPLPVLPVSLPMPVAEPPGAEPMPGAPPVANPAPAAVPVALLVEAAGVASNAVPAAPQMLVQMLLQAVPPIQTQPPVEWLAAAMQVEAVLAGALDRGVDAVTAWRNVTPSVVEAAHAARAVFAAATSDDPPNPQWLRPEWLGLAPVMQRYWRRRRYARRVLSDPDYAGRGWEGLVEAEPRAEGPPTPARNSL